MADREPLPPGILPNVTDTDPPPMNPATVVHDGYVGVDESKLSKPELAEVMARHPAPNIYTPPPTEHRAAETEHHERHDAPAGRGTTTHTTVTVSRTTAH